MRFYAETRLNRLVAGVVPAVAVAILVITSPSFTHAQGLRVLVGTVTDATSGAPLQGVKVTIVGSDINVETDRSGVFRLNNIGETEVELRLVLTGHAVLVDRVALTAPVTEVDFELAAVGTMLDRLIVLDRVRRGGSLMNVKASESTPIESNLVEVLTREPGMLVLRPSAHLGSGMAIRLRGLKSILPGQDPLIYLDGIPVYSGSKTKIGSGQILEDVLATIPLSRIDRIEVLKGSATAWQYGRGAVNGVILIYTKGR